MKSNHSENTTKEKIVSTALTLFLNRGYEGTTVRMILNEADVVTGSFYHFFKSKEDLFEEVINRFMEMHVAQLTTVFADDTQSIGEQLEVILKIVEQNTQLYIEKLQAGQLHWSVQAALLERTLQTMLPGVETMIGNALKNGTAKNVMGLDIHTLSVVVLQGITGIIHAAPVMQTDDAHIRQIKKNVISYVKYVLDAELE